MQKKNIHFVPPRVGYYRHDFRDGQGNVRIKIIRESRLCRWLNVISFSFWNRIYVRDKVIVRKVLIKELSRLRIQRHQGFWKTVWFLARKK